MGERGGGGTPMRVLIPLLLRHTNTNDDNDDNDNNDNNIRERSRERGSDAKNMWMGLYRRSSGGNCGFLGDLEDGLSVAFY